MTVDGKLVFSKKSLGRHAEPGEVVDLAAAGITAIAARADSRQDGCPANSQGIVRDDGKVTPSYDWIAHPKP